MEKENEFDIFERMATELPLTFSAEDEINENVSIPHAFGKTTVVTMFFNLKNLEDSTNETRPMQFYIDNGIHVLRLPYPMVVFCDEITYEPLKQMRDREVDPNKYPTQYIIKNLQDYEYYQNSWYIIEENRKQYGKPWDCRNTSSYFLTTMFKLVALSISQRMNYYNTTHYAWVDIGCNHIVRDFAKNYKTMLENPQPKVRICYIHYRGKEELSDMKRFMDQNGPCSLAATAFTMEADYVQRFYASMFSIFYEKLYRGVGHSEETVMAFCYDRYPELFNIYQGDYYSVFTNYLDLVEDTDSIINFFIINAIKSNRLDLANEAANNILKANENLDEGKVNFLRSIL